MFFEIRRRPCPGTACFAFGQFGGCQPENFRFVQEIPGPDRNQSDGLTTRLVLRSIPVGVTYAIWSGLGIVLVAGVAAIIYKQVPDAAAMVGMGLIIAGVIVINLLSGTTGH